MGPLKVHAYGAALALAFLLGSFWVTSRARKLGYRDDHMMELFWWILISALIGSRLYYAFQHAEDFNDNFLEIFRIWSGGLTQYGGIIGALLVGGLYIRSRSWPWREVVDLIAPTLALGEAITRIGCFLNGCCFGTACNLPWAVSYPEGSFAHYVMGGAHIHPSQIYLLLGNLVIFIVLAKLLSRFRGSARVLALYLASSSLVRFLVDFTRHYEMGDFISIANLTMTHSQWVSIGFTGLAVWLWISGAGARRSLLDMVDSEEEAVR